MAAFQNPDAPATTVKHGLPLGVIVRGSLARGLEMKLAPNHPVEDLRAGRLVVVEGRSHIFYALITNVTLSALSDKLVLNPPAEEEGFLRKVLEGTGAYVTVELRPMLMAPAHSPTASPETLLMPVRTVPNHFSNVYSATQEDVSSVFGREDQKGFYRIGSPVEMEDTAVCLNLERFVERSNGIFGKSGTGKTFLTRICLAGIIKHRAAVNLVFDMHNEYGWSGTSEDRQRSAVRGLKQLFDEKVEIFTLDPTSTRQRGVPYAKPVTIPYSELTLDDVILLKEELNLTDTAVETANILINAYGEKKWLAALVDRSMTSQKIKEFCDSSGAHTGALTALQRKLRSLIQRCKGFLVEPAAGRQEQEDASSEAPALAQTAPPAPPKDTSVREIIGMLKDGRHVVLEFGHYTDPVQYMLVANILARRIHEQWVEDTEAALGQQKPRPRHLVLTIEEAHKFLSPALARQTIFGTIAREMRKYNVTLLVVDQRPSGIDTEVLSQLGTKLVCLLDDDQDIQAVLSGLPGAASLAGVLATLDTKQQALILGHAVPMPVVVRTRTYDDEGFRKEMLPGTSSRDGEPAEWDVSSDF
ncbi:MAG: helicase HerA domain-containing protein [Chthonomonadales bacterium]